MTKSFSKIIVLTKFKFKELLRNKTFLLSAVMPPVLLLLNRFAISSIVDEDVGFFLQGFLLKMGVLLTITTVGLTMPATFLAKDKENNTLRTLMTSSVNGLEYFISSVLPVLGVTTLINILIIFISGVPIQSINILVYILAILLSSASATVLGMIIGIFSKDQMAASNNIVIFMLALMTIPMFSDSVEKLEGINNILFTGIVTNMINDFSNGISNPLGLMEWSVLLGSCLILFTVFLICYKHNGYEKD